MLARKLGEKKDGPFSYDRRIRDRGETMGTASMARDMVRET